MSILSLLAIVFPAMLLFFGLMAVGVMMGRKPISGSCGGLAGKTGDESCPLCGGDTQKCESNQQPQQDNKKASNSMSYDAFKNKS